MDSRTCQSIELGSINLLTGEAHEALATFVHDMLRSVVRETWSRAVFHVPGMPEPRRQPKV